MKSLWIYIVVLVVTCSIMPTLAEEVTPPVPNATQLANDRVHSLERDLLELLILRGVIDLGGFYGEGMKYIHTISIDKPMVLKGEEGKTKLAKATIIKTLLIPIRGTRTGGEWSGNYVAVGDRSEIEAADGKTYSFAQERWWELPGNPPPPTPFRERGEKDVKRPKKK